MKNTSHIIIFLFVLIAAVSCQGTPAPHIGETIKLAASTENFVEVKITLENKGNHQFLLSATFTPLTPSLHLYSKDIPKKGIGGLGRPTLLELAEGSFIKANGQLVENIPSQIPLFEPKELLVYPAGSIILSIPVLLPDGNNWVNDQVVVTYLACNEQGCRPPVEGKIIPIQIPGSGLIKP